MFGRYMTWRQLISMPTTVTWGRSWRCCQTNLHLKRIALTSYLQCMIAETSLDCCDILHNQMTPSTSYIQHACCIQHLSTLLHLPDFRGAESVWNRALKASFPQKKLWRDGCASQGLRIAFSACHPRALQLWVSSSKTARHFQLVHTMLLPIYRRVNI